MKISIYESFSDYAKEIREEVFVKEQGFQHEFDQTDDIAIHIVMFDEDGIPAATCRVFWDEEMDSYVLGRLAVIKNIGGKYRCSHGQGSGRICEKRGGKAMALHAQCRVADFYKKLGFTGFGNIESDEGCSHVWMKKII